MCIRDRRWRAFGVQSYLAMAATAAVGTVLIVIAALDRRKDMQVESI